MTVQDNILLWLRFASLEFYYLICACGLLLVEVVETIKQYTQTIYIVQYIVNNNRVRQPSVSRSQN